MSAAEEPDDVVAPNPRQDLIPHWTVIQARLDEIQAEARILRRLRRLSEDAAAERGERKPNRGVATNGSQEEAGKAKAKG